MHGWVCEPQRGHCHGEPRRRVGRSTVGTSWYCVYMNLGVMKPNAGESSDRRYDPRVHKGWLNDEKSSLASGTDTGAALAVWLASRLVRAQPSPWRVFAESATVPKFVSLWFTPRTSTIRWFWRFWRSSNAASHCRVSGASPRPQKVFGSESRPTC